jgi:hypothetical protein
MIAFIGPQPESKDGSKTEHQPDITTLNVEADSLKRQATETQRRNEERLARLEKEAQLRELRRERYG